MRKVIVGNHAVSYGVMLSRAQVISAYPITPQTAIVEMLSEMCADGRLNARFVKVESEHSAMACCIGAASTGARAFTATSAQGLLLMHELIHWAAGARLPIVMANVNRAVAPGWSIWSDQTDSLSQRDTGWVQFYCEDNQEVLDSVIIAYRIAEQVNLPVMLVYDAFTLSHTAEAVEMPAQETVDAFLPPWQPEADWLIDTDNPRAFGALTSPDHYFEIRSKLQEAMEQALTVGDEVHDEFADAFGRRYHHLVPYRLDDAGLVLVTSGTVSSTSQVVIDALRERGIKVGGLRVRTFRPFPARRMREILAGREKVMVIDRNLCPGVGGIFAQEVRAALCGLKDAPPVFGFIAGLGGRDISPEQIRAGIGRTMEAEGEGVQGIQWLGLKE